MHETGIKDLDAKKITGYGKIAPEEIPSLKETFIVVLLTAAFIAVLTLIFFGLGKFYNLDIEFLLFEGLFIIPAVIFIRKRGYSIINVFRINPVGLKIVFVSIIIGFSTIIVINYVEHLLSTLPYYEMYSGWKGKIDESFAEKLLFNSFYDFILLTTAVVILAGICEEMLFRGLIQQSLEKRLPASGAIFVTALFFTILHPFSIVPILILALVIGYISWRSDSIIPAVVIHAINNGLSLFTLNLAGNLENISMEPAEIPFSFFIFSVSVLIIGIILLNRMTDNIRKEVV